MDKKKKILLIIVSSLLVLSLAVTFAYYAPNIGLGAKTNIDLTSDDIDYLTFVDGDAISLKISQVSLTEGGSNLTASTTSKASLLANTTNNTASETYNVYLVISNNEFIYSDGSTPEILLKITDGSGSEITDATFDGLTRVTSGGVTGYDITTKNGIITIAEDYAIASSSSITPTVQNWTIEVYYINLTTNQKDNAGKVLHAKLLLNTESVISSLVNLTAPNAVPYLTNNRSGIYGLISDNNGNYRYSGSYNDIYNWVCFGSTEATCPANNLYRIIGVFNIDGSYKYKLIQGDYATTAELGTADSTGTKYTSPTPNTRQATISLYKWHTSRTNTWGSGTTCASSLCTKLNSTYLTNLGSTWSDKIATSTWYVGGYTTPNATASTFYSYESATNGSGSTLSKKVGLMYVSDYGYAANSTYWNTNVSSYDNTAYTKDWLYNGGYWEWTISRNSSYTHRAFSVYYGGYVDYNYVNYANGVRPSFYLVSTVEITGGNGTYATPYRLS